MPKKLDMTPDGVICSCCGQDKSVYHFYSRYGKTTSVTRFFFVNPNFSTTQCWECNGGYRCLGCGIVQDANQFRVGGRFCIACRNARICKVVAEAYARKPIVSMPDTFYDETALENEVST